MKKTRITSALLFLFAASLAAQQTFYSVLPGFDGRPLSIRETTGGHFFVSNELNEYYLLDSAGGVTWAKKIIQPPGWNYYAHCGIPTSDGGYIVAGHGFDASLTTQTGFLAKTNSSGQVQWTRTGTTTDMTGYRFSGIEQAADGGYVVAGGKSNVSLPGNRKAALVVKIDAAGNTAWSKAVLADTTQFYWSEFSSVKVAPNGDYIAAGLADNSVLLCRFDPNGNLLWVETFLPHLVRGLVTYVDISADGGCIVGCTADTDNDNQEQACLLKTDAAGNFQWCKFYGNENQLGLKSVRATGDGGFAFIGMEESTQPWGAAITKTDASGNLLWATKFDSVNVLPTLAWASFDFEQAADQGFIFGGYVYNSSSSGYTTRIVKTDPEGQVPCIGSPLSLSVTNYSATANTNGYAIPGESLTAAVFAEQAGILDDTTICSDTFVVENPEGFGETAAAKSFRLYPNPANEILRFETNLAGTLNIYDATGQLMRTEMIAGNVHELSLAGYAPGLYFAVFDTGKARHAQKFIRE